MVSCTRSRVEPQRSKVLIVDDHPLIRERVSELINQEPDLVVCGEAEDGPQALRAAAEGQPDLAIVDITLKDGYGIELIRQFKDLYPELPVLVLSMHDETLYGERALRAGAKGYLTKQQATTKVLDAVRRILRGDIYVSDALAAGLLHKVTRGKGEAGADILQSLTDRELEVFQLLGEGLTVREVAGRLEVSGKTVEAHREHIKHKMNFKTSSQLLRFAIEHSLQEQQS
jgi:DNA-binding NarL/FixJ family response regulator